MKIFKTLSIRGIFLGFLRFLKKDVLFTVFLGLFLAGYLFGCILEIAEFEAIERLSSFLGNYIYLSLPTLSLFNAFIKILKIIGALLLLVFCLGMFVPGQLLLTLLCLIEGIAAGSCVTYLYSQFGFSGMLVFGVIILPSLLIFLNFQFIMVKRAFDLSFSIFRSVFYGSGAGIYKKYKEFMLYFGVMIAIGMICSIIIASSYMLLGKVLL